jgi:hypothetical protein
MFLDESQCDEFQEAVCPFHESGRGTKTMELMI